MSVVGPRGAGRDRNVGPILRTALHGRATPPARPSNEGQLRRRSRRLPAQSAHAAAEVADQSLDIVLAEAARTAGAAGLSAAMQQDLPEQAARIAKSRLDVIAMRSGSASRKRRMEVAVDIPEIALMPRLAVRRRRQARNGAQIVAPRLVRFRIDFAERSPPCLEDAPRPGPRDARAHVRAPRATRRSGARRGARWRPRTAVPCC